MQVFILLIADIFLLLLLITYKYVFFPLTPFFYMFSSSMCLTPIISLLKAL